MTMTTIEVKALDKNFNLIEVIKIKIGKYENALRKAVEIYNTREDIFYFTYN